MNYLSEYWWSSKFRSFVLSVSPLDIAIVFDLLLFFIIDSSDWFHDMSAIAFQISDSLRKRFSDFKDRLYCLDRIFCCTVSEDIELLKFWFSFSSTLHMLLNNILTSIYPIELAIPAPYPRILLFYLQTPNSRVNQYRLPSLATS